MAAVLSKLYGTPLSLPEVMHQAIAALSEVVHEPGFHLPQNDVPLFDLVLAPIRGGHSIDYVGPQALDTSYTVEQFYNAQIKFIVSQLQHANIDWCSKQYESADRDEGTQDETCHRQRLHAS